MEGAQPDSQSCVQKKEPDQLELWGLKEGTYLFQLTAANSDEPQSSTNVTITVLSAKQTEGERGGQVAPGAPNLPPC